jgi:hypothetical protein
MTNKVSFVRTSNLSALNLIAGQRDYNINLGSPTNSNIFLFNEEKNCVLKSIQLNTGLSFEPYENLQFRLRGTNRDISQITEVPGNILNPISGPFSGIQKRTDYDLILNSKKSSINFEDGIDIGGFQIVSFSVRFYQNLTTSQTVRFTFSAYYEQAIQNRNV